MSYKEFLDWVETQVKIRMGKEVRIYIHSVAKNNSVLLDGLSILEQGDNVSPAIYLNGYYREYLEGVPKWEIIDEILELYQMTKTIRQMDTSFYTDADQVKDKIVFRLVNKEKNQKLLKEVPYRSFLDLAIVYYYIFHHEKIGSAAIMVKNEHMEMWGMNETALYELASRNTRRLLCWQFDSMEKMIQGLIKEPCVFCPTEVPLYVLTNEARSYGAVWMTSGEVLEQIGKKLENDFYILPSSVHECMIVPGNVKVQEHVLKEMVEEINQTHVEPEEVLADTIYFYERKNRKLAIVEL